MHTIIRTLKPRELVLAEGLPLLAAMTIAELFYKLGSFTLECIAFLATWYVLAWGVRSLPIRR